MEINDALLLKLERLTRLQLSPAERTAMRQDLTKMLAMVDRLSELDLDGVEPLRHLNETHLPPLREDVAAPPVESDQALRNAPERDGPYFKVPKVL